MENRDYEKIIPTAWLTAYPRIFTDIPFSKDIFDQLEQIKKEKGQPGVSEDLKVKNLAPELEARYKLGDRLIYESGLQQIVEFLEVDRSTLIQFSEDHKEFIVTHSYAVEGTDRVPQKLDVQNNFPWRWGGHEEQLPWEWQVRTCTDLFPCILPVPPGRTD